VPDYQADAVEIPAIEARVRARLDEAKDLTARVSEFIDPLPPLDAARLETAVALNTMCEHFDDSHQTHRPRRTRVGADFGMPRDCSTTS
jgi:hypothetical protein